MKRVDGGLERIGDMYRLSGEVGWKSVEGLEAYDCMWMS
jgi:hypothetical protein